MRCGWKQIAVPPAVNARPALGAARARCLRYYKAARGESGQHRVTRSKLIEQHGAINTALQARAPSAARAAIEAHLDYVEQMLNQQRTAERNEAIAQQRYANEKRRG